MGIRMIRLLGSSWWYRSSSLHVDSPLQRSLCWWSFTDTLIIHTYFILAELRCDIVNYRLSFFYRLARSFGFLFGGTRNKCKTSNVTVISDRCQKEKVVIGSLSTLQRLSIESEVKMQFCRVRFEKYIRSKLSFSSSLSLLQLLRHHCYLPENFRCNLKFFEGDNFSDSYF